MANKKSASLDQDCIRQRAWLSAIREEDFTLTKRASINDINSPAAKIADAYGLYKLAMLCEAQTSGQSIESVKLSVLACE
jgi:hypothetical protein